MVYETNDDDGYYDEGDVTNGNIIINNNNEDEDEDDEFFGNQDDNDEDDNGFDDKLGIYEDKFKSNELYNIGYLESYEKFKEIRLQEGFDIGYKQTFDIAYRIGSMLGTSTATTTTMAAKISCNQRQNKQQDNNNNKNANVIRHEEGIDETIPNNHSEVVQVIRESLIKLEQQQKPSEGDNTSISMNETVEDLEKLESKIEEILLTKDNKE